MLHAYYATINVNAYYRHPIAQAQMACAAHKSLPRMGVKLFHDADIQKRLVAMRRARTVLDISDFTAVTCTLLVTLPATLRADIGLE